LMEREMSIIIKTLLVRPLPKKEKIYEHGYLPCDSRAN
jgi:hypothetical protein